MRRPDRFTPSNHPLDSEKTPFMLEADREGRFTWKPRTLKLRYLPGDNCEIDALAQELIDAGLIVLYEIAGIKLAFIPSFAERQVINNKEGPSKLPAPGPDATSMRNQRDAHSIPAREDAMPTREDATGTPPYVMECNVMECAGKDGTPPKTAGAVAPTSDPIFGHGLDFLKAKGCPEKSARGFLGLMRKSYGDALVAEALVKAETDDISEPIPWLRKYLESQGSKPTTRRSPPPENFASRDYGTEGQL